MRILTNQRVSAHVSMATRLRTGRNFSLVLKKLGQDRRHSSSSANPVEIEHFNKLAASWWAPYGPSKLLHEMNPLRHDFIASCVSSEAQDSPPRKRRFIDIGCGGGIFAESAARLVDTERVLGIDPSSEVINVAKRHARQDVLLQEANRLTYENKSIEDIPVPKTEAEQYDVLTLFEVIEHISRPGPFLDTCLPFVKPGGWLILSTIARSWTSWVTTKVVAEDIVGLVPQGTHDWDKYINDQELKGFFEGKTGWGGEGKMKVQGVVYFPGLGWKSVPGSEKYGNYFFGIRKDSS